jgi:hypothetical protein
MMNYQVINYTADINTPHVQSADIQEKNTGHLILEDVLVGEAKKIVRHLNMGGGFDGWTPGFFLAKVPPVSIL